MMQIQSHGYLTINASLGLIGLGIIVLWNIILSISVLKQSKMYSFGTSTGEIKPYKNLSDQRWLVEDRFWTWPARV